MQADVQSYDAKSKCLVHRAGRTLRPSDLMLHANRLRGDHPEDPGQDAGAHQGAARAPTSPSPETKRTNSVFLT